ncbi:1461_t:CDS:2 [Ambispora gerdemannii]|uniref:1461_t:CDS:1 n=1 Tax=Ambispora gerdemannii TaxID=144530 RepID=A0A9N9FI29_9GLOM|nr:1461_t:CDS:2 [Ambispora gerdemannii]
MSFSLTDRLVELNDAREKGLITEGEYKTFRTRILESFSQVSSTNATTTTASCRPAPPPIPPPRSLTSSTTNAALPSSQIFIPLLPSHSNAAVTMPNSPPPSPQPHSSAAVPLPSGIPQNRILPDAVLQKRRNVRSFTISEIPSDQQQHDNIQEFEHSLPEIPPPPYTPPETRRRRSSSFFRPKSATELRKELDKLKEDAKREQDSWKMEEARLSMRMGTKPEEIERIRKRMRDSAEKYKKKIDVVSSKLRQAMIVEQDFR